MTDYTELKRLAEAATAGPWVSGGNWVSTIRGNSIADCPRGDEEFIAAANPTAVLDLIAENDQLRDGANMRAIRSLRGDCADLKAERDQLKAENAGLKTGYEAYEAQSVALTAEVEALRKNSNRYQWLKINSSVMLKRTVSYTTDLGRINTIYPSASELDLAIDTAMGKGEQS